MIRADSPTRASNDEADGASPSADAWLALHLLAADPASLGGVVVRSGVGPVRDRWLADLRALLPPADPWRSVPIHVDVDRLIGGLDLAATLERGRPVAQRGLLAQADGGIVVLSMAERTSGSVAAVVCAAIDAGEVVCARHGVDTRETARFAVVALDEGEDEAERVSAALRDRLAFAVDLRDLPPRAAATLPPCMDREAIAAATARLPGVTMADTLIDALCAAAVVLGVDSLRPSLLAVRAARVAAALAGRSVVAAADAASAARLVLAPRATRLPPEGEDAEQASADDTASSSASPDADEVPTTSSPSADDEVAPASSPEGDDEASSTASPGPDDGAPAASSPETDAAAQAPSDASLDEVVLEAAAASIPAHLLARLRTGSASSRGAAGREGAVRAHRRRGRPLGVRSGRPVGGARLDLVATLRAGAPWQRVRGRPMGDGVATAPVRIRADDFRIGRFAERARTTTIFAVDASGSAALHRLAETKGAVELLLADCYVRRDSVAVIAFRGRSAELLLAPTRSLARAKRSLAELAGGGGTPLAHGLDAARDLALDVRRRGDTPTIVVLSDGRANIGRDGASGRDRAEADARSAARRLGEDGVGTLFVDTSPQPHPLAREIATTLGAVYLPLPHAQAETLSDAVRTSAGARPARR